MWFYHVYVCIDNKKYNIDGLTASKIENHLHTNNYTKAEMFANHYLIYKCLIHGVSRLILFIYDQSVLKNCSPLQMKTVVSNVI